MELHPIANLFTLPDTDITSPANNNVFQYNSTSERWENRANLTMDGLIDMQDNPITDINYLDFNLVNGVAAAEGRLVWNDDEGTLNLGLKGGDVNLQIGLEQVIRGKNVTGTGTTNGRPARISSASGSPAFPEFSFAEADVFASAGSIGLFTEDIVNNSLGYVTTFGFVRDMDTSGGAEAWSAADRIWVGNTIGTLTNIEPASDERKIFIGIVIRAHASEGIIWVSPVNVSYLRELSGNQFTTEVANDFIQFDGTVWENRQSISVNGDIIFPSIAATDRQIDLSGIDPATNYHNIIKFGEKCTGVVNDTFIWCEGVHQDDSGNNNLTLIGDATGRSMLTLGVDNDTYRRFNVDSDGRQSWGPGNGALDVFLERSSVGELTITGDSITTGKITGAELLVDNITIDGSTISSNTTMAITSLGAMTITPTGDLTVDVSSNSINLIADTATNIGDGGVTNFAQFAGDGELTLHGTARVRLEIDQVAFSTKLGASNPAQVLKQIGTTATMLEPQLEFSNVVQNDVYFIMHMPENVDGSENVEFHLMWHPGAGWTAGNYMWKLEYIVKSEDADSTTVASTTISADVTPANATDFIETVFVSTIDAGQEQTITCHLYRDVANDNGDDTGDMRFVEIKYTINKLGEAL